MDTVEFLRHVLPSQGVYFSAVPFPKGGYDHVACSTIEELAARSLKLSEKGKNAFFACSGFKHDKVWSAELDKWQFRTQENAMVAKAQWLDIDCGNDEYPTQTAGIAGLVKFVKTTGIPAPNLLVSSGNGIHAYWLFTADVPKEQWQKAAKMFKAIAAKLNFAQTDTTRTADAASVLRPIGVINDKTHKSKGITQVRLIAPLKGSPIEFRTWVGHLIRLRDEHGVKVSLDSHPEKVKRNSDLAGGTEYPPSFADRVADRCNVLGEMRSMLGAGQLEPLWYECLGTLAFCEDGLEKAHEWSSGHEDYDEQVTLDKFNQRKKAAGPTTCDKYRELSGACKTCTRNVKNPIVLGRPAPEHQTEVVVKTETGTRIEEIPDLPEIIKRRYVWKNDTLLCKKDDEAVPVCAQLVIPQYTYFCRNDETYKLKVKARIKPFVWREADINSKSIAQGGTTLMGELGAKLGVYPRGAGKELETYMKTWAEVIQVETEEVQMHDHIGWYEDGSFLLGDKKYLPTGEIKTVRLSDSMARYAKAHTPTGDLTRYCELIDIAYNRPDHQMYQFTWLAAFASPLLRLFTNQPIGIPLIGWSADSGFGKTTAALTGISVWGDPSGLNQTASASKITEYALYAMAGIRRDIPVLLDEATVWEPKRLADFSYAYSDGRPKIVGQASGGLKDTSDLEWGNFIYVNSNKSAVELMSNTIVNCAPMIARFWQYEFDVGHERTMTVNDGMKVFQEMFNHYAVAGDAYLKFIVPRQAQIKALIGEARDKFSAMAGVQKDARNWLLVAATVWVAFGLTRKMGLHKFPPAEFKNWIVRHMGGMQKASNDSKRDIYDLFASMMSDLQAGLIVTNVEGDKRSGVIAQYAAGFGPPRGTITGRAILDQKRVYLMVRSVIRWCSDNGVSYNEMRAALVTRKWLLNTASSFYLGKGTSLSLPLTSCWTLDADAFQSKFAVVPKAA